MKGESRSMHSTKTGHCATRVARPTKDHRGARRRVRTASCHETVTVTSLWLNSDHPPAPLAILPRTFNPRRMRCA